MRKATMVAVLAALLMITAGIALADSFRGNDGPNTIRGADESDRIEGLAGNDNLFGRGDDYIGVQGDGRVDRVELRLRPRRGARQPRGQPRRQLRGREGRGGAEV